MQEYEYYLDGQQSMVIKFEHLMITVHAGSKGDDKPKPDPLISWEPGHIEYFRVIDSKTLKTVTEYLRDDKP